LISNHFDESVSGPEKAGVGGSIPSLATNNFNNLDTRPRLVHSTEVLVVEIELLSNQPESIQVTVVAEKGLASLDPAITRL